MYIYIYMYIYICIYIYIYIYIKAATLKAPRRLEATLKVMSVPRKR